MFNNILKIARFELKRSTIAYDRRVLMVFLPSLAIILLFFFLFLKGGHLFENKFYTASAEDAGLYPIFISNGKFVVQDANNTDLWTRTNTGLLLRNTFSLRSKAATESLLKTIKEYNSNVYSFFPENLAYPLWIKIVYVKKNDSSQNSSLYGFSNLSDSLVPDVANTQDAVGGGAGTAASGRVISGIGSGGGGALKSIIIDEGLLKTSNDRGIEPIKPNEDGYLTPGQLSPALPFEPIYMALSIIVVLTFVSILYSNRVYDEKVNKKGSLLMIAPLKTYEIIVGKTLPHFFIALIISMVIVVVNTQDIVSVMLLAVLISSIVLVYFSVAFLIALLSRSFKELSFLGIFYISMYSLFLLIPSFLIGYSEASYASPLTVVVKLLLNEPVGLDLFVFTLVPQLLLSLLLFYIGALIFTSEDLFSYRSIASKLVDAHENFIKKPHYLILSAMGTVPFVFIFEMMLVVVLISIKSNNTLVSVLVFAAFIEESFKAIGIYAIYSRKLFKADFADAIKFGVYTGLGFFLAEKLMLVVVIAAFIEQYSLIVFAGLLIPLMLHIMFSTIFSVGMHRFGSKSVMPLLVLVSILHCSVNIMINLYLGGGNL